MSSDHRRSDSSAETTKGVVESAGEGKPVALNGATSGVFLLDRQIFKQGLHQLAGWAHILAAVPAVVSDVVKPALPYLNWVVLAGAVIVLIALLLASKLGKIAVGTGAAIVVFCLMVGLYSAVALGLEQYSGDPRGVLNRLFVSIAPASGELTADVGGVRETSVEPLPEQQRITYSSRLEGNLTHIVYRLPYLDLVRRGGPLQGLSYDRTPFDGETPALLITVMNSRIETVVLTTVVLDILSSTIINEAIPVFDDYSQACLRISNQGWGDIGDPKLTFVLTPDTGSFALFSAEQHSLALDTIADSVCIPMRQYVPNFLRDAPVVRVSGKLEYDDKKSKHSVEFSTRIELRFHPQAPVPPTAAYNVRFKAGEAGRVAVNLVPAQEIKPGETEAFLIRLKTDKTSSTRMAINFQTIAGETTGGQELLVDIFVPQLQTVQWVTSGIKRE